ncbi:aldo/keto reductase [uncultured Alsobacter sp.]|uniref:aldo/keto reductase n=1 Tax=uncultured Alsobacter sp. TaxID=1748258 RepID=UPI0025DC5B0F|nr:aldo/keto reductase [uncultured Alsobacter sp.]
MQYRTLGRTGLKVSELCLGAMTFGREATEAESFAMLDRFVAAGGNFIDTADVYSRGLSEEIVGKWLERQDRDGLVIATKVRWGTDDPAQRRPNRFGLGRKHIIAAVEASLKRLRTDYIDLYQTHLWDSVTPVEETIAALDDLVRSGKVRYVGASNYASWQLQKSVDHARRYNLHGFVSLQALYNLLDRELEWEIVGLCRSEGLGIIPWSPLRGGWLTGKFHRGLNAPPAGTRVELAPQRGGSETWAKYANEHTWGVVDALGAVAQETGRSHAQVALRWLIERPGVSSPIIGARSVQQLDDNLGAVGWTLENTQTERLDTASRKPLPYPYDHMWRA